MLVMTHPVDFMTGSQPVSSKFDLDDGNLQTIKTLNFSGSLFALAPFSCAFRNWTLKLFISPKSQVLLKNVACLCSVDKTLLSGFGPATAILVSLLLGQMVSLALLTELY